MSQVLIPFSHCPQQMSCHPRTHPHGSSGSLDVPPSLALAWVRAQARRCMHCTVTCSAWHPLDTHHAHELKPHPITVHTLALALHCLLQALPRQLHHMRCTHM